SVKDFARDGAAPASRCAGCPRASGSGSGGAQPGTSSSNPTGKTAARGPVVLGVMFESQRRVVELVDGARVTVDGETDLVTWLDGVEQRERLDLIAHCHGFHEALDLRVLHDHLLLLRTESYDRALASHKLGLGPQRLVLAGDMRPAVTR